jgi:hypothetical protein
MGNRRQDHVPRVLEADKAPVEQVIHARCQQQPVLTVEAFLVALAIAPGLAVAGYEVNWVLDTGNSTEHVVNVGGFTESQRRFLDYHRDKVLLRAVR